MRLLTGNPTASMMWKWSSHWQMRVCRSLTSGFSAQIRTPGRVGQKYQLQAHVGINIQRRAFSTGSETSETATRSDPDQEVVVTIRNRICTITFNRPEKRNAVNLGMVKKMVSAMQAADASDDVTLIVLTGTGPYFTSGMDLKGFSGPKPPSTGASSSPPERFKFNTVFLAVNAVKKPLIALVNGPAVGFGVTMLGLFDSVYASDSATFQTHFTRYGVPPEFASTYTFPTIMGYARTNRILLFGQKLTAQEAYDAGLVSCILPSASFRSEVDKKLEEMANLPLKSLIYTKELVRGREEQFRSKVSDEEQSYFDPNVAREVTKAFASRKS